VHIVALLVICRVLREGWTKTLKKVKVNVADEWIGEWQ